jgi:hypothetical protein
MLIIQRKAGEVREIFLVLGLAWGGERVLFSMTCPEEEKLYCLWIILGKRKEGRSLERSFVSETASKPSLWGRHYMTSTKSRVQV